MTFLATDPLHADAERAAQAPELDFSEKSWLRREGRRLSVMREQREELWRAYGVDNAPECAHCGMTLHTLWHGEGFGLLFCDGGCVCQYERERAQALGDVRRQCGPDCRCTDRMNEMRHALLVEQEEKAEKYVRDLFLGLAWPASHDWIGTRLKQGRGIGNRARRIKERNARMHSIKRTNNTLRWHVAGETHPQQERNTYGIPA